MAGAVGSYYSSDRSLTNTLSSYGIPSTDTSASFRFYMILGIAQDMLVDFIPAIYQTALGTVGTGATANVHQRLVNPQLSLAFKQILYDRILLNEMIILSMQEFRSHPYIIDIEGISWEAAADGEMRPVLVFQKSNLGDMYQYMRTHAGSQSSFLERWSLCTQIASAIGALHSAQTIHGDIKPQNILVFKGGSAGLTARLADFGYSRWLAPEDATSLIYLPSSRPWTTPEYHHRGFDFAAATKTDVFSFGVYILWLLFYNQPGQENDFMSDTSDLEERPMIELARSQVLSMSEAQDRWKAALGQIFEACLANEPGHRLSIGHILSLFQSASPSDVMRDGIVFPKGNARLYSSARFQIAPAMRQLFEIDFRVRTQIFECLERLAEETRSDGDLSVYEDVCLQLAFCYKMGFGTPRSEGLAESFLTQSQKHQALYNQIMALKCSINQGYHPSTNFNFFYAAGHISTTTDAQYYREQKLLVSIQAVHEREIMDWTHVLGPAHWMIVATSSHYQDILQNIGLFAKAEDVARDAFTKISQTGPENHTSVIHQKFNLAKATFTNGHLDMAEKLLDEVIEAQKNHSIPTMARLNQENFLACIYSAQGKTKKASALMRSLVESFSSTFGADHARTLIIRYNLCEMLRFQRRIKKAIPLSESLLQAAITTLGEEHEFSTLVKNSLSRLLWERRGWIGGFNGPRADGRLRLDYIKASQDVLGNDHPWTIDLLFSTVRSLVGKARFPEAITLQEQIITHSENRPGPDHPQTVGYRNYLGYIRNMYRSYLFFEKIGSLHVGQYVLTPSLRVREGLERICWPLYKKKDITNITPFTVDLSNGSREE